MEQNLYELDGASLQAAQNLEYHVTVAVRKFQPQNSGNLAEISASWQSFYKKLMAELQDSDPDVLQQTGLTTPSYVVLEERGAEPRCYSEYPAIFTSPEEKPRYFMYVPVAYNGKEFVPTDARLIEGPEKQSIGDLLFAGGWLGNAPLVVIERAGLVLPEDFKPTSQDKLRDSFNAQGHSYLLSGKAIDQIKSYKKTLETHSASVNKAFDATRLLIAQIYDAQEGIEIESGDIGIMFGHHLVDLNKSISGIEINMKSGLPQMPPNDYFKISIINNSHYITFRDDTNAGKTYREMVEVILKPRPEIKDFIKTSGPSPILIEQGGKYLLKYFEKPNQLPTGLKPISRELLNWIRADERDRNGGVTPPPMPQKLWQELSDNFERIKGKPKFG